MEFNLSPLHPFARTPGKEYSAPRLDSAPHDPETLRCLLRYLENATTVHAWMGYSKDLIEGKFDTPGGHAILSDGVFYWRLDAIDYLRHYPIRVSDQALSHFASNNWAPPRFEIRTPEFTALLATLNKIYDHGKGNDIVMFHPKPHSNPSGASVASHDDSGRTEVRPEPGQWT